MHLQAGQCGNQIGAKVSETICLLSVKLSRFVQKHRVLCSMSRCFVPVRVPETTPWDYQCVLLLKIPLSHLI